MPCDFIRPPIPQENKSIKTSMDVLRLHRNEYLHYFQLSKTSWLNDWRLYHWTSQPLFCLTVDISQFDVDVSAGDEVDELGEHVLVGPGELAGRLRRTAAYQRHSLRQRDGGHVESSVQGQVDTPSHTSDVPAGVHHPRPHLGKRQTSGSCEKLNPSQ